MLSCSIPESDRFTGAFRETSQRLDLRFSLLLCRFEVFFMASVVQASEVSEDEFRPQQLLMLLLCVYSLGSLATETFAPLSAEYVAILDVIDNLICGIFLFDFVVGLLIAQDKLRFLAWGWIDLVSSIPVIDIFRAGRIVRVIRILRVLRGIRLAWILARYLQRDRANGAFLAVIFLSILLLLLSSVAILQVEQVEGANIHSASDALWWSVVTMTTVGYGDKYPVTTVGRIIASVVMISGVGLFGALSGSVTSWILNPVEVRQEVDLDAIHLELAAIRTRLDHVPAVGLKELDPQLTRIMDSWGNLTENRRRQILRLMDSTAE
ncbi:ion transporter [Schlesneria paludicola]|uniref:ion transporter n=1 Tax=Schlesneria paludicola TaxID=360056 RepID=UPI00029ABFC7|nr:ion transporter [Schlesneria paludicola]